MNRMKLDARDVAEFVEKYNPFGFKDDKGAFMIFKDYDAAYFELLTRLYNAGPKYIDMILLHIR